MNPMQLPIKIILNSIYGKTGQKVNRIIGNFFNPAHLQREFISAHKKIKFMARGIRLPTWAYFRPTFIEL